MADDQATLGRFADDGAESEGPSAADGTEGDGPASEDGGHDAAATAEDEGRTVAPEPAGDAALVCPWCLAPESAFESGGLTGRWCGRCSAVLPVDADWFRAREVVARRPMYGDGDRSEGPNGG